MGNKVIVHINSFTWDADGNPVENEVHEYLDKKAGIGPEGTLIVTEVVPDVSGQSKTGTVENMVAMYAKGEWSYVEYM